MAKFRTDLSGDANMRKICFVVEAVLKMHSRNMSRADPVHSLTSG